MWNMGEGFVAASPAMAMPRCAEEKVLREAADGIPACSTSMYSAVEVGVEEDGEGEGDENKMS
jgi:hypothetical protein